MIVSGGHNPPPDAAMSIGVATGCLGIFGFLCPAVLEVADKPDDRVRLQQAKATIAALGLGAAGSAVTKTPWPFLTAVIMIGLLMWEFESNRSRGPA